MNIRETLNKNPMIGWAVAGVLLVGAGAYWLVGGTGEGPVLTEKVTVLFTDTGEEVEMRRGHLEMRLLEQAGPVDPGKGIENPKTKVHSGVILNKDDWAQTVEKLNAMKKAAAAQSGSGGNGNSTPAKK